MLSSFNSFSPAPVIFVRLSDNDCKLLIYFSSFSPLSVTFVAPKEERM